MSEGFAPVLGMLSRYLCKHLALGNAISMQWPLFRAPLSD